MEVKRLWGNSIFDHTASEAVGNSGGILCVWDPNMFRKSHHIISDNFVALFGSWIPNKLDILFISVYAPQSQVEKRILWNYIVSLLSRWNGEYMVLGDFNEVRSESERMGSLFNAQGAKEFNNFILNAGLVDIQLEGYSYTWAHPSASKMNDQGGVSDDVLLSRMDLMKQLQDIKSSDVRDQLQKAKVQWAIEGDENSKFQDPGVNHSRINFSFPTRIKPDQVLVGGTFIPFVEIRVAVWACGEIKSLRQTDFPSILSGCNSSFYLSHSENVQDPKFVRTIGHISFIGSSLQGCDKILAFVPLLGSSTDLYLRCMVINLKKSQLLSIGVHCATISNAASSIGCAVLKPPFMYFGYGWIGNMLRVNAGGKDFVWALLFKWVWRFISQENTLWFRFISALHGKNIQKPSFLQSSIWNTIIKEVNVLKLQGVDLLSFCKIRVGSECSVAEKIQGSLLGSFRRLVRGGVESQQLERLRVLLESVTLSSADDRWVWELNGEGIFNVKDARQFLDDFFLPKAPVATRWIKIIHIKGLNFRLGCFILIASHWRCAHLFFLCVVARDVLVSSVVVECSCRLWILSESGFLV
ncbi:RNA-directed DNA polymerase, eukaryota [Tanacetum coccineum]